VGSPGRDDQAVSLRARVQRVILGAVGMALLLFAVPLAIAVGVLVHSHAVTDLQADATRVVALVGEGPVQPNQPVSLGTSRASARVAVYTAAGLRGWGHGPQRSALAARRADAAAHDGRESGELAVVIPLITDGQVVGSVRAALPLQDLILETVGWWAAAARPGRRGDGRGAGAGRSTGRWRGRANGAAHRGCGGATFGSGPSPATSPTSCAPRCPGCSPGWSPRPPTPPRTPTR